MSSEKRRLVEMKRLLRQHRVASNVTFDVITRILSSLDCPRALTVEILLRNKEIDQLVNLVCDPLDYRDAAEFRDAYAATKLLAKFRGFLNLGIPLRDVALAKFDKFESLCKQTNTRFQDLGIDPLFRGPIVWLHNAVKQKISEVLGEFRVSEFFDHANWGPGATTEIPARNASSANKFQCETGITRELYTLLSCDGLIPHRALWENYPLWALHLDELDFPKFVKGNKVVTVPKDATTDRVIAIEPGLNLWFQLAAGSTIKRRLLRYGIDLRYQAVNQKYAYESSKDGLHATVDFSSASDSIASSIVEELLPKRWFTVLDSVRSHFGSQGDVCKKWNKFSSMGNGFTFQLQTLLFYAMAQATVEYLHDSPLSARENAVSVYGDDVIIPSKCLALFTELTRFYGFSLNMKKTHSSSQFRESCGSHFYSGVDVKPFYLKDSLTDVPSVYRLANAVRRFAHRQCNSMACDARFRPVFDYLVNCVPKPLRLMIPETLGDGGFISNWDEATPRASRDDKLRGIEGWRVRNAVAASKTRESDGVGVLLTRLWVPSFEEERNRVPLRGRTRLVIKSSLVTQWYSLGQWI